MDFLTCSAKTEGWYFAFSFTDMRDLSEWVSVYKTPSMLMLPTLLLSEALKGISTNCAKAETHKNSNDNDILKNIEG